MRATMPTFFILALLTFLITPGALLAQEAPELSLPDSADIRIIVDISGSMKKNDPGNLRQPAVRLLARMLPDGSQAGVWTFGQYVNMLVPHGEVTDEWRETAINRSRQINSVALRTNLGKAIEVASDRYITSGDLKNTHYILLTDGNVDISDDAARNRQEELRILDTVLPALTAKGVRFHPVALSSEADADFLKQLASKSGGRFQIAESSRALSRTFLEALNSAIPQQQIPIKGNAFTVDKGVKEFTALIFQENNESSTNTADTLELVRPDGRVISLSTLPATMRWVSETGYNLITVNEPLSGEWRIKGTLGEGSRVTVVSDLKMIVSAIPSSFSPDQPINLNVAFFEDENKITSSDFLQVLTVSLIVTSADGLSGSKILSGKQSPADGVYSDMIESLPAAGKFTIDVVADGQTFSRKFSAVTEFILPEGETVSAPEAEPVIESPIDITLAEQPEVIEPPAVIVEPVVPSSGTNSEQSGLSLWVMLTAGAVGLLVLVLLIWFFLKRRNTSEVIPDQPESVQSVPEEEPVPEEIPEVTQEVAPEEIPEVTAVIESDDEVIPELDDLADELDAGDEEYDDEFGLEDFDLSDSDRLPGDSDNDSQKK
jgi:hypothetical protein